jgi:uncharacterized membrane protein YbaN (DUF454 family)
LPREGALRSDGAVRVLLVVVGWLCMVLGLAGVFLPLLPGTPFLLLAAACFVRASPRMHAQMLANPHLGPLLEQWHRDRSVPRPAKRRAYALVAVSFACSIALVDGWLPRVILALCGLGLLAFLYRLPTGPARVAERPPD